MKSIKNIFYLIGISFLFLNAKCNEEVIKFQEEPNFSVLEVSTQLMVPGIETEKPRINIAIKIKEVPDDLSIDSVYFQQVKALKFQRNGVVWEKTISEKQANTIGNYNGQSLKGKMLIFYTENKQNYFTIINDIVKKEAIYMP